MLCSIKKKISIFFLLILEIIEILYSKMRLYERRNKHISGKEANEKQNPATSEIS